MLRKQILLLGNTKSFQDQVKNIFASWKQNLLPGHMFPSLATIEAMLTSANFCSRLPPRFFYYARAWHYVSQNNVSSFIYPESKNISLLPAKHDKKNVS